MSNRDIEKSRKSKKDSYTAYEIYHKTKYLLWPVVLWLDETFTESPLESKKTKLLKSLKNKPKGLYFFSPGNINKIELFPLNGKVISKAKIYISNLNKVQKSFKKKFGEPDEWSSRIHSRLNFLKNVYFTYEQYLNKNVKSLPLEEIVFFATSKSARPSQWLSLKELKSFENSRYSTLRDLSLIQRGVAVDLEKPWIKYLKKQNSIPLETLTKIYQNKLASPFTLDCIHSFEDSLSAIVFEEIRLRGESLPESINHLPALFSELKQFLGEPELRACLCRDFIRTLINDEVITHLHRGKYFIQCSEMNKFAKLFLKEHLELQEITFDRENFTIFDVFHWFTGVSIKRLKKEIFFKKTFQSVKALDKFENSTFQKCIKLMPEINRDSFFNLTYQFLLLSESTKNPNSLICIISTCREFVPPGNEGKSALEMAEFIFQNLIEQNPEYIDWLSNNLKLLIVYTHNKTMNKKLHCLEFEKSAKVLKQILGFTPKIYNSNLESKVLLDPKYLFALIHISPSKKCLQWILKQNKDWLESAFSNQDDWYYVMNMPEEFALKVLAWGQELNESGLDWSCISTILDKVDDIRTSENEHLLSRHLDTFKKLHIFSKEINVLIKKKLEDNDYGSFYDICSFFQYIDKLDNGWENITVLWDLFFKHIENYIESASSDDLSFYQEDNKINWLATFKVPPLRSIEILNIIPVYNYELYEQTLEPLKWLAKNQKIVFDFLDDFLKGKENFNRIVHFLKMLKVSLRLDQPQLNQRLLEWSIHSHSSHLEELKLHRKIAKFSNDLPANIRKVIDLPEKLKREQKSLSALFEKGVLSKSAILRLDKITKWLKSSDELSKNIELDLKKLLPESIANAKMDSLLEISESLCKDHWRKYSGRPIENWSDDWRNAIQLCFFTEKNRRVLRKLMLNAAGNDFQWIFYHPQNIAFLNSLPVGFKKDLWIKPPKVKFTIGNDSYTVEAESNLLKILQMGNYFGSCLSVGQMNDFSTIANAVEVNKHVLWIKNSKGKIVGRKLIVLNQFGELYGFNSYGAALGSKNENPWFKIILDLYCQRMIKQCGGELQNKRRSDEKLILFSEWYDDGIERFDGWVMDIQKGKKISYISKKVKFKKTSGVNLRAALWLKTQNGDIVVGWDSVKVFQRCNVNSLSISQK